MVGLEQHPKEWNDILSGGERQRIGFARVFYHKPDFVVLDEATSAINPEQEIALYKQCQEIGVTMLSIAHRYAGFVTGLGGRSAPTVSKGFRWNDLGWKCASITSTNLRSKAMVLGSGS